jgi:hypothetical protein
LLPRSKVVLQPYVRDRTDSRSTLVPTSVANLVTRILKCDDISKFEVDAPTEGILPGTLDIYFYICYSLIRD